MGHLPRRGLHTGPRPREGAASGNPSPRLPHSVAPLWVTGLPFWVTALTIPPGTCSASLSTDSHSRPKPQSQLWLQQEASGLYTPHCYGCRGRPSSKPDLAVLRPPTALGLGPKPAPPKGRPVTVLSTEAGGLSSPRRTAGRVLSTPLPRPPWSLCGSS